MILKVDPHNLFFIKMCGCFEAETENAVCLLFVVAPRFLCSLILPCPLVISTNQPDFLTEKWQLLTSSVETDLTLTDLSRLIYYTFFQL